MKFKQFLNEKRKNSEKNSKISIVDALEIYKDREDMYIQFSDIKKLGINPKNQYATPLGIYSYPLKYIWNDLVNNTIPFADHREYVILFRATHPKLIDVSTYTISQLNKDLITIEKIYGHLFDINNSFKNLISKWGSSAKSKNVSDVFWNITRNLADFIVKNTNKDATIVWNKILRNLGYKGFTDKKGMGVIHPNEPIQSMFLDTSIIKTEDLFLNKRYDYIDELDKFQKVINDLKNNKNLDKIYNEIREYMSLDPGFNNKLKKMKLEFEKELCNSIKFNLTKSNKLNLETFLNLINTFHYLAKFMWYDVIKHIDDSYWKKLFNHVYNTNKDKYDNIEFGNIIGLLKEVIHSDSIYTEIVMHLMNKNKHYEQLYLSLNHS